jgi:hypothetical protein
MRMFWTGRLGAVLGLCLAVLLATPVVAPVAHAAKGPKPADNAAEMKAREAFAAGRYDEALELFAKLYAQTLHPVYLRNIGRCHQKMRQPDKAIDSFNEYLAKEKSISADERNEIEGYIKEMEALRDEQAKQATPPTPPANNNLPPPVTPIGSNPSPPPNYYPQQPGYGSPSTAGTLVSQPLPPPRQNEEQPIYKKWWFWTGIAVVVAAGVVTTVVVANSGGVTRPDCPAIALGNCK